jgi:hypothetical protein
LVLPPLLLERPVPDQRSGRQHAVGNIACQGCGRLARFNPGQLSQADLDYIESIKSEKRAADEIDDEIFNNFYRQAGASLEVIEFLREDYLRTGEVLYGSLAS